MGARASAPVVPASRPAAQSRPAVPALPLPVPLPTAAMATPNSPSSSASSSSVSSSTADAFSASSSGAADVLSPPMSECQGATLPALNTAFPTGTVYEPWAEAQRELLPLESVLKGRPVELAELFRGRRVVLLGLPGAFTPNCTNVHIPSYVQHFEAFRASGVDAIVALVVNDVFVVEAWRKHLGLVPTSEDPEAAGPDGAGGKANVRILCDTTAAVARKAGMLLDTTSTLGRPVIRRFCALLEDGVLRLLSCEADGLGLLCTLAPPLLNEVRSKKYRTILGILPMARDEAQGRSKVGTKTASTADLLLMINSAEHSPGAGASAMPLPVPG